MKIPSFFSMLQTALLLSVSFAGSALAQDNVTVPKSRLEELERKERELERIKNEQNKPQDEKTQPKPDKASPPAVTNAEPLVTHVSPPMASLPPLVKSDAVDSMDLANYYRTDAAAADQRYRHQKFTVRGEIVGFEKPLLLRNYKILLKTADRDTRVICDFLPPENSNAVFTTDHGSTLVR